MAWTRHTASRVLTGCRPRCERGRSARVGYLTNAPRTIGLYGSYSF